MRFIAEGPSIPDDLLLARDQGRVIFFCGAGVSRARANLPDFFGLAKKVISALGVPQESAACKLIHEAQEIDRRIGVSGVISADRVFGLLEREFLSRDIESAVAFALKPEQNCDLSAHNILLDLATTPEGITRLVTTNFDRLFDDCGRNLKEWQPPRLPDPSRPAEMNGIIYLHGKAKPEYDGAEGDGFVLSSSEFGRAYLSDGWATTFFREIIEQYVVVFVGYTADDPPVQYLLEALNKTLGKLENVYAFQSGGLNDAASRWRHKGVEAIAYEAANGHSALWRTLEAWADRAKDPDRWYCDVIQLAKRGPEALAPHERGQVAHVISTYEGVKKFSEENEPPPAEWLCVFDPCRRYAKPGHLGNVQECGQYVDPFDLYGLDSDVAPIEIDPDDHYAKRELPLEAWDAFALNRQDQNLLSEENFPSIRGHWAANTPNLIPRLGQLGIWIAKISNQPASIWWAAHQISLHRDIRSKIRWELARSEHASTFEVRQAWRSLFEAWEHYKEESNEDLAEFKALTTKDGWDSAIVRQYADIRRPYIEVGSNYWGGPKPPADASALSISDLIRRDVKYPDKSDEIHIPDAWLSATTKALRQNLEFALALEIEIGGYGLANISSIVGDDRINNVHYERTYGLSASIIEFISLFARLITLDVAGARQEFTAWPTTDDTIFARMRVWVAGKADFLSPVESGDVIDSLSDEAFWDSQHQRDLLLVLAGRWNNFNKETRESIEKRLLSGPAQQKGEEDEDDRFSKYNARSILNRIHWLSNHGCSFTFDLKDITQSLQLKDPLWKPEHAVKAVESLSQAVWVQTTTEHSPLLDEPLSSILSRARKLRGRMDNLLVASDPFAGLAAEHPARAFSALTQAAKLDEFPEWAWRAFLNSEERKNDRSRLAGLIAERLASYSDEALATLIRPVSDWLLSVSRLLAVERPNSFDRILQKLAGVFLLQPLEGQSSIVRGNKRPDWVAEALNAPVGKVAQALFNDTRVNGLKTGEEISASWLDYANKLLNLSGDMGRYAFVIFSRNLNWFYKIDPLWAEEKLISAFESNDEHDRGAAWAGFLWGAKIPSEKLYMRLKYALLTFATSSIAPRRAHNEALVGIILAGWGSINKATGERYISNEEMRVLLLNVDDDFRSSILWQAGQWSSTDDEKPSERWFDSLPEFLEKVWPRQISVKSPKVSVRLFDLAFSNVRDFTEVAAAVLPLLTKIDRYHRTLPNFHKWGDKIVALYPEQTLALLNVVLPDNASAWPYGIEKTLQRIGETDVRLNTDERLMALKRKWSAR